MSEKINVDLYTYQKLAVVTKKEMSTMSLAMDAVDEILLVKTSKKHIGFCLDSVHQALGIVGELGELIRAVENKDLVNIREEAGDMCWFVAVACNDNGLSFNELATAAEESLSLEKEFYDGGYDTYGYVDFIKKLVIYNDGVIKDSFVYKEELIKYLTNILRHVINQTYWRATEGFDLESILEVNINKLNLRFGEKFSQYFANNRDLDSERIVLESL